MDILTPLETTDQTEKSVTVLVYRTVATSERESFLEELTALLSAFDAFPGTLGSRVYEQEEGGEVQFGVVQRFASQADHQAWVGSETFRTWQERVAPPRFGAGHVRRYYGLESLFTTSKEGPARWKMTVVLTLAAFPLSLGMSLGLAPLLGGVPPLLSAALTTPVMVVLMSYVTVPLFSRLLQRWLASSSRSSKEVA